MPLTTDDLMQINELAVRYCHAVDKGDGESFAATFTSDGVLNAPSGQLVGTAALTEFGTNGPVRRSRPRHFLSNVLIDGDGDVARFRGYVQLFSFPAGASVARLDVTGEYDDVVRRVDGRWLFETRTFFTDQPQP
jgi:hypothetical protein